MGLAVPEIELLDRLIRTARIRSVLALGRPALMLPDRASELRWLGASVPDENRDADGFPYWEPFLKRLEVEKWESLDFSFYEKAGLVHDLNLPVPVEWHGSWDLVIDPGTCEHVWNFTQAVENAVKLVRPGGWIYFDSPCEGMAGHGFYQISPEFFYRTFSPDRGFSVCEVWLNRPCGSRRIYHVRDSRKAGERNPSPQKPSLLFCLTRKSEHSISAPPPVQSDYQAKFAHEPRKGPAGPAGPAWSGRWKNRLRSVFGKKTWAKLVVAKQRLKNILRPGLDPSHYRAVTRWPPEEWFKAKRANFPPQQ